MKERGSQCNQPARERASQRILRARAPEALKLACGVLCNVAEAGGEQLLKSRVLARIARSGGEEVIGAARSALGGSGAGAGGAFLDPLCGALAAAREDAAARPPPSQELLPPGHAGRPPCVHRRREPARTMVRVLNRARSETPRLQVRAPAARRLRGQSTRNGRVARGECWRCVHGCVRTRARARVPSPLIRPRNPPPQVTRPFNQNAIHPFSASRDIANLSRGGFRK